MRYDGWTLDDDVIKLYHEAVHDDGRRVSLDWSPYRSMTQEAFELLVRLGFPTRSAVSSPGPLNMADLRRLVEEAQERAERQHDTAANQGDK